MQKAKELITPPTVRLPQLDILRGLFVVAILINHLALWPNALLFFTGRSQLWFSAAEGFMAISGFLIGYIYLKKFTATQRTVTKKILKRTLTIYLATIFLGLFCMLYISATENINTNYSFYRHLVEDGLLKFIFDNLTLQYSYLWAEFLSNYVVFMLLSPIALWLLSKRKWWIVTSASICVWLLSLNSASELAFVRTSWQLIFFLSLVLGAHYAQIKAFIHNQTSKKQRAIFLYVLWGVALLLFLLSTYLTYGYGFIRDNIVDLSGTPLGNFSDWWWYSGWAESGLFKKENLGLLRFITGTIVFLALFTFTGRYSRSINRYTGHLFENLGKKALLAYVIHAIIVMIITTRPYSTHGALSAIIINTFISASAVALLWILVHKTPQYLYRTKILSRLHTRK